MLWLALSLLALVQGSVDPVLVENLRKLAPDLDVSTAERHVLAAEAATDEAIPDIDAELLLAVAYVESHFDASMTSRVEGGARKTGPWRSEMPAGTGHRFCGVMQTQAEGDWDTCLAQRDLASGYAKGAAELREWLRYAHGDLAAALDGYGCGFVGMRDGCHHGVRNYARRVLAWRERIRRGAQLQS